jgi:hypothetical protein
LSGIKKIFSSEKICFCACLFTFYLVHGSLKSLTKIHLVGYSTVDSSGCYQWNLPKYLTFHAFRVFSVYVQICYNYSQFVNRFHSTYPQYTNRSIPRIRVQQIQTAKLRSRLTSFRLFTVNAQIHSAHFHCTTHKHILVYVQIHSRYSATAPK